MNNKLARWIGLSLVVMFCGALFTLRARSIAIPQKAFNQNEWRNWAEPAEESGRRPSKRQQMIADLVTNVLPGLTRDEVEGLLGKSPSHEEMRRFNLNEFDEQGREVQTGEGYYYDDLGWDLLYGIGIERVFIWDHTWQLLDPEPETLLLRFDNSGVFESWYIDGSQEWPSIVGEKGAATFRRHR